MVFNSYFRVKIFCQHLSLIVFRSGNLWPSRVDRPLRGRGLMYLLYPKIELFDKLGIDHKLFDQFR